MELFCSLDNDFVTNCSKISYTIGDLYHCPLSDCDNLSETFTFKVTYVGIST